MKNIIILIALSTFLFSCNEDPVSNDDKKIITPMNDKIVFTTIDIEDGLWSNMKLFKYEFATDEIKIIDSNYISYLPMYNGKGFVNSYSKDDEGIYLYDFRNEEVISKFKSNFKPSKYTAQLINENDVIITTWDGLFWDSHDIHYSNLNGDNTNLISESATVISKPVYLMGNNKMIYNQYSDYFISDIDGTNSEMIDFKYEGYIIIDIYKKTNQILIASSIDEVNGFFIYNIDNGSHELVLEVTDIKLMTASLSPDKEKLVFMDHSRNLYMYNIENKEYQKLLTGDTQESNNDFTNKSFQWTPDSRYCIFIRPNYEANEGKLGIINANENTTRFISTKDNVLRAFWVN